MAGEYKDTSDNKLRSTSVYPQSKKDSNDCEKSTSNNKKRTWDCGKNNSINKKDTKDGGKSSPRTDCPKKGSDSGKDAFGRKACPKKEKESKKIECHESIKKFFDVDDKKYKSEKDKNKCDGPKMETKCEDTFKKVEEGDKYIDTAKKEKRECTSSSSSFEGKSSGCQSQKEVSNGCGRMGGSSKKSFFCKHFGKQNVECGPKPKSYLSVDADDCLKMPKPKVMTVRPCLPKVEKSISCKKSKVSCIATKNCPHLNKLKLNEFFCIDARNKKLNECIKQYMKTDPNQINFQCAQFMKKRIHTVTQPPEACCGYPKLPTPPPPSRAGFVPPKPRQLLGRWAPTAGLYIASTAVLAAWVTEWDAVLKHIPFYRPKEEVSQSSTLTIGANEGNGESSSTIADYEGNGENPSSIAKEGNGGSTSS